MRMWILVPLWLDLRVGVLLELVENAKAIGVNQLIADDDISRHL